MSVIPAFTSFDEDPFFQGHSGTIRPMDRNFRFGFPAADYYQQQAFLPFPAHASTQLYAPPWQQQQNTMQPFHHKPVFPPFEPPTYLMSQMNDMTRRMSDMSTKMTTFPMVTYGHPDGHVFTQSSVYSYKDTGEREPQVYEAHHSQRMAPGGVREEKRALRDTSQNLEKYSVGRHINDRGHVMEKITDTNTRETQQKENLYGLYGYEMDQFKRDWHNATSSLENSWPPLGPPHRVEQKALSYSVDPSLSRI